MKLITRQLLSRTERGPSLGESQLAIKGWVLGKSGLGLRGLGWGDLEEGLGQRGGCTYPNSRFEVQVRDEDAYLATAYFFCLGLGGMAATSLWSQAVSATDPNCPGPLVRAGRRINTQMEEGLGHTQKPGEGQEQGQGE